MPAIYEVKIDVAPEIEADYLAWLSTHAPEVMRLAGFTQYRLYRQTDVTPGARVYVVHYLARAVADVNHYIENLSAPLRAEGLKRFGGRFRAERRVLDFQDEHSPLTEVETQSQIEPTHRKENPMTTQINWQKIRQEFNRFSDVEALKSEVQRIGAEIRKFDFHTVLSPAAATKVKAFEKRYAYLMRTISQGQRQMDREFNRILREIKGRRTNVNKIVKQQKAQLEKLSVQLKKRWAKSPARKAAAKGAKTTASRVRKTARKTTRKKA